MPAPSFGYTLPVATAEEREAGMCQIAFDVPDEVLHDNKMSADDALAFARRATALGFYSQRGVSLGYCAQIAGTDKASFVRFLGDNGVSIFRFDSDEEFLEEAANA
jgi:predicted HTH domain antitoxin